MHRSSLFSLVTMIMLRRGFDLTEARRNFCVDEDKHDLVPKLAGLASANGRSPFVLDFDPCSRADCRWAAGISQCRGPDFDLIGFNLALASTLVITSGSSAPEGYARILCQEDIPEYEVLNALPQLVCEEENNPTLP